MPPKKVIKAIEEGRKSLIDDYNDIFQKYHEVYGDNFTVLYQNGKFFEIYGVDNGIDPIIGNARHIAQITGLQLSRRNKSNIENSKSNPLMAGFNINQIEKYIDILVEKNNMTVVIVEQHPVDKYSDGTFKRAVTGIVGPSTNIRYGIKALNNYLMIVAEDCDNIGLCAIDVSTGKIVVFYSYNTIDDKRLAIDGANRFIQTLSPREIIIYQTDKERDREKDKDREKLEDLLTYDCSTGIQIRQGINEKPLPYKNAYLSKIYVERGILSPIEYIGLEKYPFLVDVLIECIDYCYNLDETIVQHLQIPRIWDDENILILDNNCLLQLNIISNEKSTKDLKYDVISLIDKTSTAMGKRYFRNRLLMPFVNADIINDSYNKIEILIKKKYVTLESTLCKISDIERLHRKLELKIIKYNELSSLQSSYSAIKQLIDIVNADPELSLFNITKQLPNISLDQSLFNLIENTFVDEPTDEILFRDGMNEQIDECKKMSEQCQDHLDDVCYYISDRIGKGASVVDWTSVTNTSGTNEYYFELTTNRWEQYKKSHSTVEFMGKQINVSNIYKIDNRCTKSSKLSFKEFNDTGLLFESYKNKIITLNKVMYLQFLENFYRSYHEEMKYIVSYVSMLDFYVCCAKMATVFNYCRPEILSHEGKGEGKEIEKEEKSKIITTQLRHPLIETIQTQWQYVPQDVSLDETRGILLFGVNCSGKSSLMKAIGIATIMAQAGLYVPAKSFQYVPYKTILTRIVGTDNIIKGQSSFSVEMTELRGILKRASKNALILGDEICHGTETVSAISIVTASIIKLSESDCNYVFATHLHHLSKLDRILDIKTLKMFHLKVICKDDQLIYDRKLESGPGNSIYGLEVAKAMKFSNEFILLANDIRKEILEVDPILENHKSNYNNNLFLSKCSFPDCRRKAVDTHHIKFQCTADENGFIGSFHKDHLSNLIPLCKPCHQMIHSGNVQIDGYIYTSDGVKLLITNK